MVEVVEEDFRKCIRCGLPFRKESMTRLETWQGDIWICSHCVGDNLLYF